MAKTDKKVLAVITARGGSKGIPRKNIALLGGKPLVTWTIEAALHSSMLSHTLVSTDDTEIADIARRQGVDVPFLRPKELAGDDSAHIPVAVHALEWLQSNRGERFDYLLLLQPTSPLRTSDDIDAAIRLAYEKNAESVVSVCETDSHLHLTKRLGSDGRLEDFYPEPEGYLRRQAFPPLYILNGAIYFARSDVLIKEGTFYTEQTYAYVMPRERSLDINTHWDLRVADLIVNDKTGEKHR